jgi:hypothetical protein
MRSMRKRTQEATAAILLIAFLIPAFEYFLFQIPALNNSAENLGSNETVHIPSIIPQSSAPPTFSFTGLGTQIFSGPNSGASITGIESVDFVKNESGYPNNYEDWNDFILSDSAGNIIIQPGIANTQDPFTTA